MAKNKIVVTKTTNHTLWVQPVDRDDSRVTKTKFGENVDKYSKFWTATNFDAEGVLFFVIGKYKGEKEYHVCYPKTGSMWHSFGTDIELAIEGAMKYGWQYA